MHARRLAATSARARRRRLRPASSARLVAVPASAEHARRPACKASSGSRQVERLRAVLLARASRRSADEHQRRVQVDAASAGRAGAAGGSAARVLSARSSPRTTCGDALRRIVDDDRQLVGPEAVGAVQHEVADAGGDVLRLRARAAGRSRRWLDVVPPRARGRCAAGTRVRPCRAARRGRCRDRRARHGGRGGFGRQPRARGRSRARAAAGVGQVGGEQAVRAPARTARCAATASTGGSSATQAAARELGEDVARRRRARSAACRRPRCAPASARRGPGRRATTPARRPASRHAAGRWARARSGRCSGAGQAGIRLAAAPAAMASRAAPCASSGSRAAPATSAGRGPAAASLAVPRRAATGVRQA